MQVFQFGVSASYFASCCTDAGLTVVGSLGRAFAFYGLDFLSASFLVVWGFQEPELSLLSEELCCDVHLPFGMFLVLVLASYFLSFYVS